MGKEIGMRLKRVHWKAPACWTGLAYPSLAYRAGLLGISYTQIATAIDGSRSYTGRLV